MPQSFLSALVTGGMTRTKTTKRTQEAALRQAEAITRECDAWVSQSPLTRSRCELHKLLCRLSFIIGLCRRRRIDLAVVDRLREVEQVMNACV
jgi:hypothetical protein